MTETRTIRTVLELNATRFTAGAASASAAARSLSQDMARLGSSGSAFKGDYDKVGTTLLGVGTAAVTGLGLATKAAMSWESAWAGVTKTVDGNAQQMGALEEQLRGLAKTLPASHQEIAAVAEAAGQLGVQRESVAAFTKTMIDLGETTNLSAEDAATAIAQFSNVMHVSAGDVDNLGAALVDLGNKGASTEADILNMAQRLSGAGALIGASSQDILGLSSALADVGISAEAGGGSITRVLQKMNTSVLDGGDKLEAFAQVAGVSADEFAAKWRTSPVEAFALFEKGINGVTVSGGNAVATLRDLGIKSSEETRAVMSLASNYQGLEASLQTANSAWEQNTALVAEAAKRYETTESRVRIAGNQLRDAAIDLGGALLPALAEAAQGVAGVAEAFGNLPGPVQSALGLLGLAGGAAALTAGGVMKLVPAIVSTVDAFRTLQAAAPAAASALTKVGKAVGLVTLAFAATTAITAYGDSLTDFSIGANEAAAKATRLATATDPLGDVFSGMGMDADLARQSTADLASGLDVLANGRWWGGIQDAGTNVTNIFGAQNATLAEQKQRLEEVGQGLAALAQTDLSAAQESFTALFDAMGGSDETFSNLMQVMPAFRDQLVGVADAAGLATDDATLMKIATGEITPVAKDAQGAVEGMSGAMDEGTGAAEEQAEALNKLNDLIQDTAQAWLGARGSARDYQAAIDDATAALEKNGQTLDRSTEAGRANEAALDGIASSAVEYAHAQFELNGSIEEANGILADGRQHYIDQAVAMGMSREEAEASADSAMLLTDAYREIPTEVSTTVTADTSTAEGAIAALQSGITSAAAMGARIPVNADTTGAVQALDEFKVRTDSTSGQVTVDGDTAQARAALGDLETAIWSSSGDVTINGNPATAESTLATLITEVDGSNGTVTINGQSVPADRALDTVISRVNAGNGTITIKGNKGPADQATNDAVGHANRSSGTIRVGADTAAAVGAIDRAARDRTATITVRTVMVGAGIAAGFGRADGGWIGGNRRGLAGGGWVPGAYPGKGVDNVLWPVAPGAYGGRYLGQPLAGTEFVVNGHMARQWGPALEAINAGLTPQAVQRDSMTYSPTFQVSGPDASQVVAVADAKAQHAMQSISSRRR